MKRVLIIAAHSDDEALGCGGTIARHVDEGDIVHGVFVADGVSSRQGSKEEEFQVRMSAMEQAGKVLGISNTSVLGYPDNKLDTVPLLNIVQSIEKIITAFSPEVIYTHHYGDLNIDHRVVNQSVMTACRPFPKSSIQEIYAFEVMSSTEWSQATQPQFLPNVFIDIEDYWEIKKKALEAYRIEMREPPHSRCIDHLDSLAKHRGYSAGYQRAEAFELIRSLR